MSSPGSGILLVGLMGAGKSSVGHRLAARWGVPYLDNDDLVEARAGASKAELLARRGEPAFRELEAEVALDLIEHPRAFIGALPSGAVLTPSVFEALERRGDHLRVVWLRASLETLSERLSHDPLGRPFLEPDLLEALRRLAPAREAAFRSIADLILDVEGRDPDVLAEAIDAAFG